MPLSIEGSAVVIIARRFNVTAARQHWLVKQGIIGDDDLLEGSLFSDALVQVRTERFQLLLLPDQLQFVPTVTPDEEAAVIREKLGKIVETLPHVPYKGLGLNFTWLLVPEDGNAARVTKDMFFVPDRPLFRVFAGGDAQFGGYLSKDFGGFRLKLEVNPITVVGEQGPTGGVQFAFNFHHDVPEDGGAEEIMRCLPRWDELRAEAKRIVEVAVGRG
jgi:hypothetical protein